MIYLAILSIVWTVMAYLAAIVAAIMSLETLSRYRYTRETRHAMARKYAIACFVIVHIGVLMNVYAVTHSQYLP